MMDNFDEGLQSAANDPMDAQSVEFPFDELDGQEQPLDRAAFIIHFLNWLRGDTDGFSPEASKACRMRLDALLWTLRPNYFPGSPSLTKLAHRMHIDESALSRIVADITRRFGIHNRAQAHGDGVRKTAAQVKAEANAELESTAQGKRRQGGG